MSRYARRLQKIGSSMLISLPSEWVKNNNLKKGNMVMIEVNRNNSVSLYPSDAEAEDVKEVNIPYLVPTYGEPHKSDLWCLSARI